MDDRRHPHHRVPHKALTGEIKAYYIMGEDPLQTEADLGPGAQRHRGAGLRGRAGHLHDQNSGNGRCPAAGHLTGRARRRLHLRRPRVPAV